jgi:hypothetical protein
MIVTRDERFQFLGWELCFVLLISFACEVYSLFEYPLAEKLMLMVAI